MLGPVQREEFGGEPLRPLICIMHRRIVFMSNLARHFRQRRAGGHPSRPSRPADRHHTTVPGQAFRMRNQPNGA